MERNTLMAQCYPKLKDYCREKHGLEFQVFMRHYDKAHCYLKEGKVSDCYSYQY